MLVVIITSAGDVSKMLATFERAVDPGLVAWAGEYLNERLVGLALGARMLHSGSPTRASRRRSSSSSRASRPPSPSSPAQGEDALYVDGTARLIQAGQIEDAEPGQRADRRCSSAASRCCGCCAPRSAEPGVYVRIGHENELPAMHSLAVVAAGYGLARRRLGTVSVIGPVRMDYAGAIATVREAAHELSRFVEDAYAEN